MRICVAVKPVASPDRDASVPPDAIDLDRRSLAWGIDERDEHAIEEALVIAEAHRGAVVVVSVGGPQCEQVILDCLAKGADRAVWVSDDGLGRLDALGAALVLAAVIRREKPDLVLCGAQSSDGASAATGIALAAQLGIPGLAVVKDLEYEAAHHAVTARRELVGGAFEAIRAACPVLLTVQAGARTPRKANLRAIKQAAGKPLARLSLAELGLEPTAVERANGSRRRRMSIPDAGDRAEMIEGSATEVAAQISAIIDGALGRE